SWPSGGSTACPTTPCGSGFASMSTSASARQIATEGGAARRPREHATRSDRADARATIAYDPGVAAPVVVILAAGQGTRMRSATPKLLHHVCGRPIIAWPVAAARAAGAKAVVVVEGPERPLDGALDGEVTVAVQEVPRGTADAVKAASSHIDPKDSVIVL